MRLGFIGTGKSASSVSTGVCTPKISFQKILISRRNKNIAQNVSHQYKTMYKNGIINITRLLMKQSQKQKADAQLIKAKYDQALAAAELELAIGKRIKGEKK